MRFFRRYFLFLFEVQVSAVSGDTPDWFIGPRQDVSVSVASALSQKVSFTTLQDLRRPLSLQGSAGPTVPAPHVKTASCLGALSLSQGPDVHFRPDGKMLYTVKCAVRHFPC